MNKKTIIAASLVVTALLSAFFILKPETRIASDGHTNNPHEAAQDENKPHSHDE